MGQKRGKYSKDKTRLFICRLTTELHTDIKQFAAAQNPRLTVSEAARQLVAKGVLGWRESK